MLVRRTKCYVKIRSDSNSLTCCSFTGSDRVLSLLPVVRAGNFVFPRNVGRVSDERYGKVPVFSRSLVLFRVVVLGSVSLVFDRVVVVVVVLRFVMVFSSDEKL